MSKISNKVQKFLNCAFTTAFSEMEVTFKILLSKMSTIVERKKMDLNTPLTGQTV